MVTRFGLTSLSHFLVAKMCFVIIFITFTLSVRAQSILTFTRVPTSIVIGQPTLLEWSGGDNSPVTIKLMRGGLDYFQKQRILTGDTTGKSFTWIPAADLEAGPDYTLQISQSTTGFNYSGRFTLYDESASILTLTGVTSTAIASTTLVSAEFANSAISSTFTVPSLSVTTVYITPTANSAVRSNTPISSNTSTKTIAVAVSTSTGAVVLIVLGFFIFRCRQKRKEVEKEPEKNHIGTRDGIDLIKPSVPLELSGYQEYELSTGARYLRPELSG